jgi:hypothetical protein
MKKFYTIVAAGLLGFLIHILMEGAIERAERRGAEGAWSECRLLIEDEKAAAFAAGRDSMKAELEQRHAMEIAAIKAGCDAEKDSMLLDFQDTIETRDSLWLRWHEREMRRQAAPRRMGVPETFGHGLRLPRFLPGISILARAATVGAIIILVTVLGAAFQRLLQERKRRRWRI